jgi:hypothetical protein
MSEEEIRLRCLELAFRENMDEPYECAEEIYQWVARVQITTNTLIFEKTSEERTK